MIQVMDLPTPAAGLQMPGRHGDRPANRPTGKGANEHRAGYHPSHDGLLSPIEEAPPAGGAVRCLHAVIVPTIRPLAEDPDEGAPLSRLPGLRLAAEIAEARECPLVVLCSRHARAHDFPAAQVADVRAPVAVVDFPSAGPAALPGFRSDRRRISTLDRRNDVGRKRTLALMLAAMSGWERVLFLDDDVSALDSGRTLNPPGLDAALTALAGESPYEAVGWTLRAVDEESTDDNSVIGHARRAAGAGQDIFIGSGALAVRCGSRTPYFPAVYNEDWLFLFDIYHRDGERRARALAKAGSVRQRAYQPFTEQRARSEELGDILAEGLFSLLDLDEILDPLTEAARADHWAEVLNQRRQMMEGLKVTLPAAAVGALDAALDMHRKVTPGDFVDFIGLWRADLEKWWELQARLRRLPARELKPCFDELGLTSRTRWLGSA